MIIIMGRKSRKKSSFKSKSSERSRKSKVKGPSATQVDADSFQILKATLLKLGKLRVRIVSDSMMPVIQVGQEVDIKPVAYKDLKRFMPVVFHYEEKYLYCHFVWHLNHVEDPNGKRVILTRGIPKKKTKDNIDLPINEDQILGQTCNISIPWWIRLWIILFKSA